MAVKDDLFFVFIHSFCQIDLFGTYFAVLERNSMPIYDIYMPRPSWIHCLCVCACVYVRRVYENRSHEY